MADLDVQTTAGAIIAIGLEPTATDQAGFDAVTVEPIGFVTDIGAIGKIFNTATLTPLAERMVIERKTSYNLQHPELGLAISETNAGQIACEAALELDDVYTIKITRQNGAIIYFTAQVSGFTVTFNTDEFENGSISLLAQTDPLKIPAPVV